MATVRGYESDLAILFDYLEDRGQPAELPVDAVLIAAFIAAQSRPDVRPGRERAARAPATIVRRIAAIAKVHELHGLPDPTKDAVVKAALAGARRRLAKAPSHAKDALALEDLEHILAEIPKGTHAGRRDRALLLVAISAALRRAELVALDVNDVEFVPEGMLVSIRASKTDQNGEGVTLAIAKGDGRMCAVTALRSWLASAGIGDGAIFRRVRRGDRIAPERLTDRSVALILKKRAAAVNMTTKQLDALAGHSLRAGGITAAAREGHNERELARLSRHKDMAVLRGYIQRAGHFDDAAQVLASRIRQGPTQ
jgi:integrase